MTGAGAEKNKLVSLIRAHDDFLIASHVNPDGDTLGSAIALSLALEAMGKKTRLFCRDGVPENYFFLPHSEKFLTSLAQGDTERSALILVDCNEPSRADLSDFVFARTAVIDHHETERTFGEVRWVEPRGPATGLMVLALIRDLGVALTRDIAVNLYAAVAVDTGTFRFGNTTAGVLRAAADLTEAGVEPGLVAENLYRAWSLQQFNLFQRMLRRAELAGPVCFAALAAEDFRETGAAQQDTENFVNFPLSVKDVMVSVLIRETREGFWKVSLRSKGDINVSKVAGKFGGGGHQNAAGCTMEGEAEGVREILLREVGRLPGMASTGRTPFPA